jgi:hypothetical protein
MHISRRARVHNLGIGADMHRRHHAWRHAGTIPIFWKDFQPFFQKIMFQLQGETADRLAGNEIVEKKHA